MWGYLEHKTAIFFLKGVFKHEVLGASECDMPRVQGLHYSLTLHF